MAAPGKTVKANQMRRQGSCDICLTLDRRHGICFSAHNKGGTLYAREVSDHVECVVFCNVALSLDGNYAVAHGAKGSALVFTGLREEGRASLRTCLRLNRLDPARASRSHDLALSYYLDGNYEVAVEACRDVIRRHQGSVATYRFLLHLSDSLAGRQSVKR
jgi:hypothetical protein